MHKLREKFIIKGSRITHDIREKFSSNSLNIHPCPELKNISEVNILNKSKLTVEILTDMTHYYKTLETRWYLITFVSGKFSNKK